MKEYKLLDCMRCQVGTERFQPELLVSGFSKDLYSFKCPHCGNKTKICTLISTAQIEWNNMQNKTTNEIIEFWNIWETFDFN